MSGNVSLRASKWVPSKSIRFIKSAIFRTSSVEAGFCTTAIYSPFFTSSCALCERSSKLPVLFHHIPNGNLICITSKQFRAHAFSRHYNCILSKDSNFIAYVSVPPIFCGDKDSIYADFSFKTGFMIEMNTYHLTHIKADFLKNTGKRVAFLSKLPITYKSSKYARESFNADTVITYPLKMWEKYENKYTHCLVILIQKRYRGCIPLYCLYTDEGAKKLNHYIKSLQKVFWYRNPKDYIEVIDPVPETDNIFILPKRNESDTVRIVGQL